MANKLLHGKCQLIEESEKIHQVFAFKVDYDTVIDVEKMVCLYFNQAKGILNSKEACLDEVKCNFFKPHCLIKLGSMVAVILGSGALS